MKGLNGIKKCRLLRQIRERLCNDNGLPFKEKECPDEHPNCRGTCPACELHLLGLNKMLEELKREGVKVNYDGIKDLYAKEIEAWRF